MSGARKLINGWPLLIWTTALVLLLAGLVLQSRGRTAAGYGIVVGVTAMTSTIFFLGAYTAAAMHRLVPNILTTWQRRNRRQLGVSFAMSHTVHALAIIGLLGITGDTVDPVTLVAGGAAYVFICSMAATSFDRTAAALGPKRWKQLHTWGAHYIWFVMIFTYATTPPLDSRRLFFILLLLAGLGVRLAAERTRRTPVSTT